MVDVLTLCAPLPVTRTQQWAVERTRPQQQFVSARAYNDVSRRRWDLSWNAAPKEVAEMLLFHWDRTFGGTLAMDWTTPEGEVVRVRFVSQPSMRWRQRTARVADIRIALEEVSV